MSKFLTECSAKLFANPKSSRNIPLTRMFVSKDNYEKWKEARRKKFFDEEQNLEEAKRKLDALQKQRLAREQMKLNMEKRNENRNKGGKKAEVRAKINTVKSEKSNETTVAVNKLVEEDIGKIEKQIKNTLQNDLHHKHTTKSGETERKP